MRSLRLRRMGLIAAAVLTVSGLASAGNLPRELTEAYEPAVSRIRGVYDYVTVKGTVLREYPQRRESISQEYTLRNSGDKSRLDIKTTSSYKGGLNVGTVEVYLAAPEASFYGIGDNGTPAIDTSRELTYAEAKLRVDRAFPVEKPYAMASGTTLLEMLQQPQISIGEVKKLTHRGQQFVKIVYDRPLSGGENLDDRLSYVLLSPSEGWAVREYSRTTGRGAGMKISKGKISYSGRKDGVPFVEKIETWEYEGSQQACVLHEVVNISRFEPGDPNMIFFGADGFK
jgi:hypothetical protein